MAQFFWARHRNKSRWSGCTNTNALAGLALWSPYVRVILRRYLRPAARPAGTNTRAGDALLCFRTSSDLRLLPLRLVAVRAGTRFLQKFLFLGDKSRMLLLNLFENLLAFR